jgi:hypothetical protein
LSSAVDAQPFYWLLLVAKPKKNELLAMAVLPGIYFYLISCNCCHLETFQDFRLFSFFHLAICNLVLAAALASAKTDAISLTDTNA